MNAWIEVVIQSMRERLDCVGPGGERVKIRSEREIKVEGEI
jgi:hypothetical protein